MSNPLERLGIRKQTSKDEGFAQALFYFMREFHFNPLDEYDGKGNLIKKGIPIPLFNELMEQMNKHYEREAREMKKSRRR